MDELNELRKAARSRILLCIVLLAGLGIAVKLITQQFSSVLFALTLGIILSALLIKLPLDRYRDAYKHAFVRQALEPMFSDLTYAPDWGIPYDTIADTKSMDLEHVAFSADDYLRASYHGVAFERSDVLIEHSVNRRHYVTFYGQWMILDFHRAFKANFHIVQNGFSGNIHSLRNVDLPFRNADLFHSEFRVYAKNPEAVFEFLNPALVKQLQALSDRAGGKLMLCFEKNRLHAAIYNNSGSFEPGGLTKATGRSEATDKIKREANWIVQFIDTIRRNDELFQLEE